MNRMRKLLAALLAVALLAGLLPVFAQEELELQTEPEIDLEVEEIDLDATGGGLWLFPVALEDINPEFIRLVNNHYRVNSKFVVDPLVKIKHMVLNKDGSKKSGDMYKADRDTTMKLNATCAEWLIALSDAAREAGFDLYLKSAYRTYGQQASIYERHTKNGKNDGWAVRPGGSDHQTGLGCDVVPSKWRTKSMNERMGKEPECVWMAEHCQEFGFIIRYPDGKQEITEVNYEPWHLRYVGIPVATYIMENGLCLEEFTDQLQAAIAEYLSSGGDPALVEPLIQEPTD